MTQDTCVSIAPYFKVADENLKVVHALCERFVERSSKEATCLYYGFCFDGNSVFCREGYVNAEGALAHLQNVGDLLEELLKLSELTRLEIQGSEKELAKLRDPLAPYNPQYYVLEYGFRK